MLSNYCILIQLGQYLKRLEMHKSLMLNNFKFAASFSAEHSVSALKRNFRYEEFVGAECRDSLRENLMRDIYILFEEICRLTPAAHNAEANTI